MELKCDMNSYNIFVNRQFELNLYGIEIIDLDLYLHLEVAFELNLYGIEIWKFVLINVCCLHRLNWTFMELKYLF
mgnify:CR=1 FL=1